MKTIALETDSPIALRNCPQRWEEGDQYMILVNAVCAIKHPSDCKVIASHEEQMSLLMILVLFYVCERNWVWEMIRYERRKLNMQEIGSIKCFSETNSLKVSLDIFFPQSTECLIRGLLPFRMCWGSVIMVASDRTLVELDCEWHSLVDKTW